MIADLTDTQVNCIHKVLTQYPQVALAYLFGSVAKGNNNKFSDIDIALVLFENALTSRERLRFELIVEDALSAECRLGEVELHVINDAPLVFKGQVLTFGRLLFTRDEGFRVTFETSTRLMYFDFQPVSESLRSTFFEQLLHEGIND